LFTTAEVTSRILTVLRDAFNGRPTHLERDEDSDPTFWEGEIEGADLTLRLQGTSAEVVLNWFSGETDQVQAETYEQLASWAFAICRRKRLQRFITPRHFTTLVNEIFGTSLDYEANWPHRHRIWLKDKEMKYEWGEDLCRLRVSWDGEALFLDDPDEAVAWLTGLHSELEAA